MRTIPPKRKKVLTESGFLHGHRHCPGGLLHRLSQRIDLALVLRQFNSNVFRSEGYVEGHGWGTWTIRRRRPFKAGEKLSQSEREIVPDGQA